MRVLHLLSSSAFHGAETMVAELVRESAGLGASVDVIAFENQGRGDLQILDAVKGSAAVALSMPNGSRFDWRLVANIADHVRKERVDVIHCHGYKTTIHALFVCRLVRARLVTTYHNWVSNTPALRVYSAFDRRIARFNDLAVGVSTEVASRLRAHVPPSKVRQIDNGVDVARFAPRAQGEDLRVSLGLAGRDVIGFVGRVSSQKGVDKLIRAFAELHLPNARLVIVGDGQERVNFESLARELGVSSGVLFLGERRDTPALYGAFDLLVLPSLLEGFPMTVVEAMSSGLPIVASSVGEVPRMLGGGAGVVVPPGDVSALREAVFTLLTDAARRIQLGTVARTKAQNEYSARQMALTYLKEYTTLCSNISARK